MKLIPSSVFLHLLLLRQFFLIFIIDIGFITGIFSIRIRKELKRNAFFRSVSSSSSLLKQPKLTCYFSTRSSPMDTITILPELIVFDLDMCLWSPETYELDTIPNENSKIFGKLGKTDYDGVVAINCGSHQHLRLFPGSLLALQEFALGKYENTRLAVASSAVTPMAVEIAYKALDMLEVLPGISVRNVLSLGWNNDSKDNRFDGNIKIGRSPPLSANKANTHFPLIQKETGIAFDKMLYFDDCIWDDHCGQVERKFPGIVTYRTPNGLQENDWIAALRKYAIVKS